MMRGGPADFPMVWRMGVGLRRVTVARARRRRRGRESFPTNRVLSRVTLQW